MNYEKYWIDEIVRLVLDKGYYYNNAFNKIIKRKNYLEIRINEFFYK